MRWWGRPRLRGAEEAPLRRIGLQLAALTVGLLFALLIALGIVVYLLTQHTLQESMQERLRDRLDGPVHHFATKVLSDTPRPVGLPPFPTPPTNRNASDIYLAVATQRLDIVVDYGPFGTQLPDRAAAQRALRSRASSFSTQDVGGQSYLIYSEPIVSGGAVRGVAQASISERQYEDGMQALLRGLFAVSALGLLASAGISVLLMRRALRPIRVALHRQRDFVADAAHELRTPLAIMRSGLELGLAANALAEAQDALAQAQAQNSHLTRLVTDLSLLARADSGTVSLNLMHVDLSALVHETTESVEMLAEDRGVRLRADMQEEVHVPGDSDRLRQLLLILLDNALKHTPEGGSIVVRLQRQAGQAVLQVQDSGCGIDPHDLPHLFERFYRADHARVEGSGLGLAIGRWITQTHGGQISAANAPEGGALFTISLPLARR